MTEHVVHDEPVAVVHPAEASAVGSVKDTAIVSSAFTIWLIGWPRDTSIGKWLSCHPQHQSFVECCTGGLALFDLVYARIQLVNAMLLRQFTFFHRLLTTLQ